MPRRLRYEAEANERGELPFRCRVIMARCDSEKGLSTNINTLALVVGLTVGSLWRPGASFPDITLTPEQAAQAKCYADAARQIRPVDFILHIIPDSIVSAFVSSPDVGVCSAERRRSSRSAISSRCCSVLFGFALLNLGDRAVRIRSLRGRMWRGSAPPC